MHKNEYMYSIALTAILKFNKVTKNFNNVVIKKLNYAKEDHRSCATFAVAKRKPEKNSGLYGIRTFDLFDSGTVQRCIAVVRGSNPVQA